MKMTLFAFVFALLSQVAGAAVFSVQEVNETAAAITVTAATSAGTDYVANTGGNVFLYLYNSDASTAANVVITPAVLSKDIPGYGVMTKSALTIALTAGQIKIVGPFPPSIYNNASSQLVLTYTGAGPAALRVGAFKSSKLSSGN